MVLFLVRGVLKYWLPVVLWMVFIYVASTDLMSAEHTSRFIGPFLRWLAPDISDATVVAVQLFVRKCAHLTEYAVLAALLYRALRQRIASGWRAAAFAFGVSAICASLDEVHQSFLASRTGSLWDVMLDVAGAAIGLLLCWAFRREKRPALIADVRPPLD